MEMGRLTRDRTAEPVSRDQILRRERGQGRIHSPCSADHVQDWQPCPVDPYSLFLLYVWPYIVKNVVTIFDIVDSHIQRTVLATTEETTVTQQQVSHRPIKCQSRLWSQRGTKVNRSHHGDNPLLRPTAGIQIATKSYATLQAMAPTNVKTVHQTSLLHIESNRDRVRLLLPTHDQHSQQQSGHIKLQSVLLNKPKFLKATHRTKIRKNEIPRSMVVEALS